MDKIIKVDILAVGAHPDDIELGCSGTLAKHIAEGYSVGAVDLTRGELGTRGDEIIRKQEALHSAQILGMQFRVNLELKDGFLETNEESLLKLVQAIRQAAPDIVIGNSLEDRHPDHAKGADLVSRACFLSGLSKITTYDDSGLQQQAYRPKAVYHYIQDYNLVPDIVVDITGYWEKKKASILAFGTQFYNPVYKAEESPISGLDFLLFLEGKARTYGRHIGAEHGEGFNSKRYVGVNLLTDLK